MYAFLTLVSTVISIYVWLLIAQAVLSWLVAFGIVNRYNRVVGESPVMQRVYELGSASVPFRFDVHAIIRSEDAPGLEQKLHQALEPHRILSSGPRISERVAINRLIRRRSPRDLMARGSSGASVSSNSACTWRGRLMSHRLGMELGRAGSFHFQQCTVTAESRAERSQPPATAGSFFGQRPLQHKVYEGAAEIAVFGQHRGAAP